MAELRTKKTAERAWAVGAALVATIVAIPGVVAGWKLLSAPESAMTPTQILIAIQPWTSLILSLGVPLVVYMFAKAWLLDRMEEFVEREKTRLKEQDEKREDWEKRSTARHDATEKAWTDNLAELRAIMKNAKAEFNREVIEHTTRNMNTFSAIEQRLRALETPKAS
jgi:hypothetical protein